jgi:hypothetical protein
MHVLSSRSRFAGVGLERRATTPYAPIEGGGMSAARKYTRAGTRRGAGAAVGASRAAVGAGGTAVGRTAVDAGGAGVGRTTLGAGGTGVGRTTLGAGGTGVGRATLGAGGTGVGRTTLGAGGTGVGRATLGAGGTAVGRTTLGAGGTGVGRLERKVGRGAAVVAGFGAPIGAFRCAKHLFLRASQAGSAPRLMHSPRA